MGTRVLSLWLPYLAIDRQNHEQSERCNLPRATYREEVDGRPLVALCAKAELAGLRPGMSSEDALRRVPGLRIHSSDPKLDQQFLETCAAWCERQTPFVAIDRSFAGEKGGALWLDIGSAAHLAGGEASLLADLLGRFRKKGITAKAAIADHPGSAWAACRFGHDEQRILPANGARVALAPWSLDALRMEREDCALLENAGLDRIEHLYALPRHSLSARFGDHVATRLDQALGLVDEPIAADLPLPAQQAQMIFAEPITDPEALPPLIEHLLRQLCVGLEAAGLGARRLTLALYRVDNSTLTCSVGTDRPCRDMQRLSALVGDRFDDIDLGFGLERAILDAVEIEPLLPETFNWRGLGTGIDEALPDLACRERQECPDRWFPEGDGVRQPNVPPFLVREWARTSVMPIAGGQLATAAARAPRNVEQPVPIEQPMLQESLPRPLRLLRQPEPIEAIASLPDEPPVLFRWRQHLHKVIGARGPETIAPDWWRLPEAEPSSTLGKPNKCRDGDMRERDYFAVEDSEGGRFWLFREGRYDTSSGTLPRWFLHGVFG